MEKTQIIEGAYEYRNNLSGFHVIELHYSADPAKRAPSWRERESVGVLPADWLREYELSWIVRAGKPVYTDTFLRDIHMFGPTSRRGDAPLPLDAGLVIGYDLGPTASRMAASFNLVERPTPRKWTIDEVYVENATVDEFLDACEAKTTSYQNWGPAIHVVDPVAIEVRSKIEERACADIMRLRGILAIPGERSFVKRRMLVEASLMKVVRGFPDYNVHERCTMHIEGFEGGYHYPEVSPGRGGGFGATPVKNGFSDVHDALQYAISRAAEVIPIPKSPRPVWAESYATIARDARRVHPIVRQMMNA